jgi:hypothetical protein
MDTWYLFIYGHVVFIHKEHYPPKIIYGHVVFIHKEHYPPKIIYGHVVFIHKEHYPLKIIYGHVVFIHTFYESALFYNLKIYLITYLITRGWQYILFHFLFYLFNDHVSN